MCVCISNSGSRKKTVRNHRNERAGLRLKKYIRINAYLEPTPKYAIYRKCNAFSCSFLPVKNLIRRCVWRTAVEFLSTAGMSNRGSPPGPEGHICVVIRVAHNWLKSFNKHYCRIFLLLKLRNMQCTYSWFTKSLGQTSFRFVNFSARYGKTYTIDFANRCSVHWASLRCACQEPDVWHPWSTASTSQFLC